MGVEIIPLGHQRLIVGSERRTEEPLARLDDLTVAHEGEAELPRLVSLPVLIAGGLEVYRGEFRQANL